VSKRENHVSVRLDASTLARVDAWIPADRSVRPQVTRSDVLRVLIAIALEHADRDGGTEFRAFLGRGCPAKPSGLCGG
jgi:hypothetical protein